MLTEALFPFFRRSCFLWLFSMLITLPTTKFCVCESDQRTRRRKGELREQVCEQSQNANCYCCYCYCYYCYYCCYCCYCCCCCC